MDKVFRFKQFSITDRRSAMKIGTDAVLLGAWADVVSANSVLDVGTGCGIIALMIAQRCKGAIEAIDIDKDSLLDAAENFRNSPWAGRLKAIQISYQDFVRKSLKKYDLIVSNPPFFSKSLISPKKSTAQAKHDVSLSYGELILCSAGLLHPGGKLFVILPSAGLSGFIVKAEQSGLFPFRQMNITSVEGKEPLRVVIGLSDQKTQPLLVESITIQDRRAHFTVEYKDLTQEFHTIF